MKKSKFIRYNYTMSHQESKANMREKQRRTDHLQEQYEELMFVWRSYQETNRALNQIRKYRIMVRRALAETAGSASDGSNTKSAF